MNRVLLVSSEYPPNICGGLGTHVDSITANLSDQFYFDVLTPKGFKYSPSSSNIRVHPVPMVKKDDNVDTWLGFCRAAVTLVEELALEFDFIHCHEWMTILAGVALRARWRRPLLFNIHLPQSHGLTMQIERLGIAASDHIIVNSVAVRDEIILLHNLPTPISVIPNGVNTARFHPRADWPADDDYLLFVGRLVPQKGVGTLLQALGVLLRRTPVQLMIVGDGNLELYLQRATRNLGIAEHVRFVGWHTTSDIVRWYQGAKFVLMPSFYEPFGIVALEAMACGRPVIASHTGGLPEIIDDGTNGFLVPVGDYLVLAARMLALLKDQQLLERMGSAARTRAETFSWHSVASETNELLHSLVWEEWPKDRFFRIAACMGDLLVSNCVPLRDGAWSIVPGWSDWSKS